MRAEQSKAVHEIAAALRQIGSTDDDAIASIEKWAASIVIRGELEKGARFAVSESGSADAARELESANHLAIRLGKAIGILGPEAMHALGKHSPDLSELMEQLGKFSTETAKAHGRLKPRARGPHADHVPVAIVNYVAPIYERLAGREATRIIDRASHKEAGDFVPLVSAVFAALGVDASADRAVRAWRENGRKN